MSLKFQGIRDAAGELAAYIGIFFSLVPTPPNPIIIPIPLSRRRRYERGFNQSELIARSFQASTGIPLFLALRRTRHTLPQSGAPSVQERLLNVKGCFVADRRLVQDRNVVLIDDVVTSGSTFLEAARTLKANGARRIIALAAARA